mmetsp:Transcript_6053/g.19445  ORF Transcript_6053/g.19445 Transcript_6053/m.19445 type:complete len:209 (-) Transcript_6053:211-837(-)
MTRTGGADSEVRRTRAMAPAAQSFSLKKLSQETQTRAREGSKRERTLAVGMPSSRPEKPPSSDLGTAGDFGSGLNDHGCLVPDVASALVPGQGEGRTASDESLAALAAVPGPGFAGAVVKVAGASVPGRPEARAARLVRPPALPRCSTSPLGGGGRHDPDPHLAVATQVDARVHDQVQEMRPIRPAAVLNALVVVGRIGGVVDLLGEG